MKTIRVIIRPEHFERANCFVMRGGCPLGVALRDMGYNVENVGMEKVYIVDDKSDVIPKAVIIYDVPKEQWGGYTSPYPPGHIDRLCAKAKRDISSIPTVVLDLKSY